MLTALVSSVAYNAMIRITAILAILAMSIQNGIEGIYSNDAWYAGTVAVIIIAPHAFDKFSPRAEGDGDSRKTIRAMIIAAPFIGFAMSVFRFFVIG